MDIDISKVLSTSDKLNWRQRIELQMWKCVQAYEHLSYDIEVKKLEDCVCTNFYGLDFASPIEKNIEALDKAMDDQLTEWLPKKYKYHPKSLKELKCSDRAILRAELYARYWHYRFEFVRDILAKNRGLLFGSDDVTFASQLKDQEAIPD